mgnify:CR=1 FL=1
MKFNINHEVKVKLTKMGNAICKANHLKLYIHYPPNSVPVYIPPTEDADGWSTWQLWELMREFGEHMYNGAKVPFETEIEIIEGQDA